MTAWVVDERTAIPRDDSSRSNGGHMSQVVWATSWQLGCGAKDNVLFTINGFNYTGRFYICQYGKYLSFFSSLFLQNYFIK